MNQDRRPIFISAVCGILILAFGIFTLFALRTAAGALAAVTGLFLLTVIAVWIWALSSMKREGQAGTETGGEAEAMGQLFSRLRPKCFRDQIRMCQKQLARLQEKTEIMERTLHEVFGSSTISIDRFMAGLRNARHLFLENQKQIADRILIFDEEGFRNAQKQGAIPEASQSAIDFIDKKIEENELILQRIDELNARIQTLKSSPQLEDKSAMRQLDELIAQSGLYRQKEKEY